MGIQGHPEYNKHVTHCTASYIDRLLANGSTAQAKTQTNSFIRIVFISK